MATRLRLALQPLETRAVPALVAAQSYDPDHVLVRWRDGVAHLKPLAESAEALGNGTFRVDLQPTVSVAQAVEFLTGRPNVAFAQPDFRLSVAKTPADPSYGSQWALNNATTPASDISAPEAWNTGTGTGRTIVAVIDSGIDFRHPDLAANMWVNTREVAGNGKDDDGNGYKDDVHGYDFANNDGNPSDDNGHGTHVAGTIGAVGDNSVGVTGVVWKTRLMALKFLGADGNGYMSDAVRAVNYAVANGAKVINNSYGGGASNPAMAAAITAAKNTGVIFVAAAGNDGADNDARPAYPSSYAGNNIVSVAATDRTDKLSGFSNYGRSTVDIAAPGTGVYSTLPKGRYGTYSGTSMAAPHVAGALALVWDAHPTWTYRQVIDAVLNTADRLPGLTGRVASGRLDVAAAITYHSGSNRSDGPAVSSVTFAATKARVTFASAIDVATFTAADVTLTGPARQAIAVSGVTLVNGPGRTQFDVSFKTLSATGTYSLTVGPHIADAAGTRMANPFTATTSVGRSPRTHTATNVGQWVQDFSTVASTLTVGDDVTIADLSVRLNVTHTYTKDLQISLVGPDGTRVKLVGGRGGNGDNFTDAVFSDRGTGGVSQATAPFTGTFRPESALSAFAGKSAKGTWKLLVEDAARYDTGRLNGWALTVTPR